jgi:hypothetical protein
MPILVTEYGLLPGSDDTRTDIKNSIATLNTELNNRLTYLKKKFWFSFYCPEATCSRDNWHYPNLFEYSGSTPQLTSEVGKEWCERASTGTPTTCTP